LGIAANRDFLELDESWPLLLQALELEGFEPSLVLWDDPTVEWSHFAAVLVNYTWGYVARRLDFLQWAARVSRTSTLVNSLQTIEWNSSKSYLIDLSVEVAIVPTTIVPPGAAWSPPANDYVIKPAVSSGGIGAARYRESEVAIADAHLRRLHRSGQDVVVQPYQERVDRSGETALVFIAGEFSHAIRKGALLEPDVGEVAQLWEREVVAPTEPSDDQRRLAEQTLRAVSTRVGEPSYARIDLVDGDRGPQILEVELIEPSLFLPPDGVAARKLAGHLRRLLAR
jgi:glutathione synthase/RimK-type ligase-like ATP-grasp enzyme